MTLHSALGPQLHGLTHNLLTHDSSDEQSELEIQPTTCGPEAENLKRKIFNIVHK